MTDRNDVPDWDSLPVLTEVVNDQASDPARIDAPQVGNDVPVLVDFDVPDFDFSAELDELALAMPTGELEFPAELSLHDVLPGKDLSEEESSALDAEALISSLPSLDLDVPPTEDLTLANVLPGVPMADEDMGDLPAALLERMSISGSAAEVKSVDAAAERSSYLAPKLEPELESAPAPEFVFQSESAVGQESAPESESVFASGLVSGSGPMSEPGVSVAESGLAPESASVFEPELVSGSESMSEPVVSVAESGLTPESELVFDPEVVPESESVLGSDSMFEPESMSESVPESEPESEASQDPASQQFPGDDAAPVCGGASFGADIPLAVDEFRFEFESDYQGQLVAAPGASSEVGDCAASDLQSDSEGRHAHDQVDLPPLEVPLGESISLDSIPTGVLGGGVGFTVQSVFADTADQETELAWARDLGVEPNLGSYHSEPGAGSVAPSEAGQVARDDLLMVKQAPSPAAVDEVSALEEVETPDTQIRLEALRVLSPVRHDALASFDESLTPALVDALYARVLPRVKVELTLWMQDVLELQAKQLMSGVMQHLKEDFDMMLADSLKESLAEALREAGERRGVARD